MSRRRVLSMLLVSAAFVCVAGRMPAVRAQESAQPPPTVVAADGENLHPIDQVEYPDVRSIAQDADGFVWFGINHPIEGGLLRYDGYETKRYSHDLNDERSISHNQVSLTYIDRDGTLWVGTIRGGLNRYDADSDDFTRFLHNPGDDTSLPSDDIETMLHASDGTYWVGTELGLARFNPETGQSVAFLHDPEDSNSLPSNRVRTIVEDAVTGELWIGTGAGLSVLDPTKMEFRNYAAADAPNTLSDNAIEAIERDADGVWWLGTGAGLNRYNPDTDDFTLIGERHVSTGADSAEPADETPSVQSILEDSEGRLWVGTERGLRRLDRDRRELVEFDDERLHDAVIGESLVQSLFEDSEGAIWIGTRTEGAARISQIPRGVEYHRHDPDDPDSIRSDFVARVDASAGGLWLVTDASVEHFDGETFTDHTARFGLDGGWPEVQGILAPSQETVWLGFEDGRLARVDIESGQVETFEVPAPAHDSAAWPVALAANGDLWYRIPWGFGVGVVRASGESELLIGDEVDLDGPEQAYAFNTAHFFDAEQQVLWVTGLGLTRIDLASGAVDVYSFNPANPDAVVNQLWSVDQGPDGHLWLASSNGVHEFDPATGSYIELHDEVLPTGGATDARFGPDKRLWVVSGPTLTGLDPESGNATVFSAGDEAVSDRMAMENWLSSKFEVGFDDKMYAPTLDQGLVAFSPNSLVENPTPPPVVLTGFELFGEEVTEVGGVLSVPIHDATEIDLAADQNTFSFKFSALGYEHPEHNQFRYRLDGFDAEWIYTSADRRIATYTNVPPGRYTFRVEATNNSGVWNWDGVEVAVTVMTPWHQTWWARLIALVGLVGAIAAIIRWRTRQQRRRNAELEARLVERLEHQKERDELLAAVQLQSERLQGILAAAPVGVVLLATDHRVLLENRQATSEFESLATFDAERRVTTFAGLSVDELTGGDHTGAWATARVDDGTTPRSLSISVRPIDRRDGFWPDTEDVDHPESDDALRPRGWVLLWDDITELEELQQQRARQERLAAVGRFAAGIAHDVNNVLNVIGLHAELLNLDAEVGERSREHLVHIARETGNASKFITQILDFSRQSVSQPVRLNAYTVVGAQVRQLGATMNPDVNLDFAGQDPATIWADPIQLERIVLNLVKNAQDAIDDAGSIKVTVDHVSSDSIATDTSDALSNRESGSGWVRLAVTDDGPGIADDVLPTIFEPFVTTKPVGKGTGLGLAQVAGIAAEHGGRVAVETRIGIGTTVSVLFPPADASESPPLVASVESPLGQRGIATLTMVVEDERLPPSETT